MYILGWTKTDIFGLSLPLCFQNNHQKGKCIPGNVGKQESAYPLKRVCAFFSGYALSRKVRAFSARYAESTVPHERAYPLIRR